MRGARTVSEMVEVQFHWTRGRLVELWSRTAAPASSGLGRLDAAMAMAAVRQNLPVMRRMLDLGADPAAKEFLSYRMAALAGDLDAMAFIEAIVSPSDYALRDALLWAQANRRGEAMERLSARIAANAS